MENQNPGRACGKVTRILLKMEDLNQKLKNFPKIFKLGDVASQTNQLKRPQPLRIYCNFFGKNGYFNAIWITFRTCLEPFEKTKVSRFGSQFTLSSNYLEVTILRANSLYLELIYGRLVTFGIFRDWFRL